MISESVAFGLGIAAGVVIVGIGLTIYYKKKKDRIAKKTERSDEFAKDYERLKEENRRYKELLANKVIVKNLTVKDLTSWFKENKGKINGDYKMIIASPTNETLRGIGFSGGSELDSDKNIIQFFYDEKNRDVKEIRLVSFEQIETNLQAKLIEENGIIIIKD